MREASDGGRKGHNILIRIFDCSHTDDKHLESQGETRTKQRLDAYQRSDRGDGSERRDTRY